MRTKLIQILATSIAGIIGFGIIGATATLVAIALFIIGILLVAAIVYFLYGHLVTDLAHINLPEIGYWAWFKIILIVRLVMGTMFSTTDTKMYQQPQHKKEEKEEKPKNKLGRTIIN